MSTSQIDIQDAPIRCIGLANFGIGGECYSLGKLLIDIENAAFGKLIPLREQEGHPIIERTTATKTIAFNASAGTTYLPNNDYSNERLGFLWNQVGPVAVHPVVTGTVEPTSEPTSFAGPVDTFHPIIGSSFPGTAGGKLPANFAWGLSASAYQIEGAAKDEGRGPSIWDLLSHRVPGQVVDNTNGDVLGQHYYLYKQDFARLHHFGTPWYSPSISWPRIFPFGHGPVNEEGLKHYDDVIAELVKNGIKPAVSLFHWDTPLALFNEYGVSVSLSE